MILLSAGHYPQKPGVVYGGLVEHTVASNWVDIIAYRVRQHWPVDIVPTGTVTQKVAVINEVARGRRVALAAELHFNSDPGHQGRGSETMYCPGSERGRRAATFVQHYLAKVLPPDRGIFEGWLKRDRPGHVDYPGDIEGDESVAYFLKATIPVALIIEAEFIHNRAVIQTMRDDACRAIAEGLVRAADEELLR